jgi:hypothetical protein
MTTQHPLPANVGINFADSGGRSVGIVRLRNKATEFSLFSFLLVRKNKRQQRQASLCGKTEV